MRQAVNIQQLSANVKNRTQTKVQKPTDCDTSLLNYYHTNHNIYENIISKLTLHELSQWVLSAHNYELNKYRVNQMPLTQGEIVLLELGQGMKGETAYVHPCVVIQDLGPNVFIVPCSTGALRNAISETTGTLNPGYWIGETADGFQMKTALILTNARWVNKARVVRHLKTSVTSEFFKVLTKEVLKVSIPFYAKQIDGLIKKSNALIEEKRDLELDNISHLERILELEKENIRLQNQLDEEQNTKE